MENPRGQKMPRNSLFQGPQNYFWRHSRVLGFWTREKKDREQICDKFCGLIFMTPTTLWGKKRVF